MQRVQRIIVSGRERGSFVCRNNIHRYSGIVHVTPNATYYRRTHERGSEISADFLAACSVSSKPAELRSRLSSRCVSFVVRFSPFVKNVRMKIARRIGARRETGIRNVNVISSSPLGEEERIKINSGDSIMNVYVRIER